MMTTTEQRLNRAGLLATVEDDGSIVLALDDSGAEIVIQRYAGAEGAYYVETREAGGYLAGAWLVKGTDLPEFIQRAREARAVTVEKVKPKWWWRRR